MLAVRSHFTVKHITDIDGLTAHQELVIAALSYKNIKMLCCVVYLPPSYTTDQYLNVLNVLENTVCKYSSLDILILGDFNLNSHSKTVFEHYTLFLEFCKLKQYNHICNSHGSILDLVLSGLAEDCLRIFGEAEPLVPADAYHPPLEVTVTLSPVGMHRDGRFLSHAPPSAPLDEPRARWNFYKADFQALYASLANITWDDVISLKCADAAVTSFYQKIYECIDDYVPRKINKMYSHKYSYPPWFNSNIINKVKIKYYHLKRYKKEKKQFNLEMFKYYRALVKELIDQAYSIYMTNIEKNLTKDPTTFWQFVKQQRKDQCNCNEFRYGDETVTGQKAVDAFAKYFSSVFLSHIPKLDINEAQSCNQDSLLPSAHISVSNVSKSELLRALKNLNTRSAVGPDGIPPYLVKDCAVLFIEPLLHLFNLSIETATYPKAWKISRVTPIHKGGDRSDVSNYRPIAVLSVFGKLYETILNARIVQQIDIYLDDSQHGFRSGRSTATNLINFVDYVTGKMDVGMQVDAAYFDFQKAFDRVDNDILLQKCSSIGFNPKLLSLFSSYLQNRSQYVQLLGFNSPRYYTRSGVSQGSTLGPTQFLIMVNDLPKTISTSRCLLFADDLKIFAAVGDGADCDALQKDIDRVSKWSDLNRLHFNVSKCKLISITRNRMPILYDYGLSTALTTMTIDRVDKIKDLGLTLDNQINFRDHIADICKQAYRMLGFIMRTSYHFKDVNAATALFTAYVRSKLEYNSIIWDPHEKKYSLMIEKIQRKFARYSYKKTYGYYPYMYPSLFVSGMVGVFTLELRRKMHLIMHFFLLLRGRVDNPSALTGLRLVVPSGYTRGADAEHGPRRRRRLLAPPTNLHTVRAHNAPTARAIRLLNDLIIQKPDLDIFHDRVGIFKQHVLAHLSSTM